MTVSRSSARPGNSGEVRLSIPPEVGCLVEDLQTLLDKTLGVPTEIMLPRALGETGIRDGKAEIVWLHCEVVMRVYVWRERNRDQVGAQVRTMSVAERIPARKNTNAALSFPGEKWDTAYVRVNASDRVAAFVRLLGNGFASQMKAGWLFYELDEATVQKLRNLRVGSAILGDPAVDKA